jgi:hypothetical protein
MMEAVIHIQTRVLPGHKVEVVAPELAVGDMVEVTVAKTAVDKPRKSALEIIEEMPPCQLFKTPEEADEYLKRERESWDI